MLVLILVVTACTSSNESISDSQKPRTDYQQPSEEQAPIAVKKQSQIESITLFEVTGADLEKPISEIPYYALGSINFITEELIQSVREGHSPWRGSPVDAALILTRNLIPEGINEDQLKHSVEIDNENSVNEVTRVKLTVPELGNFIIRMQYPDNSGIVFITSIVWERNY